MKYTIYQLANMRACPYGFMGWSFAKDNNFSINDYVSVYDGSGITYENGDDCTDLFTALEILFTKFNIHRPADFKGHSLSVSDIVELTEDNGTRHFFYCDSWGWEEITKEIKGVAA